MKLTAFIRKFVGRNSACVKGLKLDQNSSVSGVGIVHPNLDSTFGFITRDSNTFEDNIYFNIQAYRVGSLKFDVKDLCKEIKVGEKVGCFKKYFHF